MQNPEDFYLPNTLRPKIKKNVFKVTQPCQIFCTCRLPTGQNCSNMEKMDGCKGRRRQ